MRHLTHEEFVDLAEGTRAASSVPHLEACDRCRKQLVDLRTMMSAAADVDVPEPSPLFWDHLSDRVREAVAAEGAPPAASWLGDRSWPRWPSWALLSAAAAAVVVLAAVLSVRPGPATPKFERAPANEGGPPNGAVVVEPPTIAVDSGALPVESIASADDSSLGLVADLAADMDWDTATEAGLTTRLGGADKALNQLTDGERRELQRLLEEELAQTGA